MAKMKRNQDDKDLLIQEGFKPNLKSRGKPRALNNGGAVMSGRGPKFKGIT